MKMGGPTHPVININPFGVVGYNYRGSIFFGTHWVNAPPFIADQNISEEGNRRYPLGEVYKF
jgi:hypothetical protein